VRSQWLVAGGWWLVAGGWWLVAGGWLLAAGCWLLAAGHHAARTPRVDPSGTVEAARNETGRLNIRRPVMKQ